MAAPWETPSWVQWDVPPGFYEPPGLERYAPCRSHDDDWAEEWPSMEVLEHCGPADPAQWMAGSPSCGWPQSGEPPTRNPATPSVTSRDDDAAERPESEPVADVIPGPSPTQMPSPPRSVQSEGSCEAAPPVPRAFHAVITTITIHNIRHKLSVADIRQELDKGGFAGAYDYVFAPCSRGGHSNAGIVYVNFLTEEVARRCWKDGRKTLDLGKAGSRMRFGPSRVQGKEANQALEAGRGGKKAGAAEQTPK
mmetsp:Transcript_97403/g.223247  ORF Transcript_97403/g.223247 Transcript_97403/m.223247 type:complete len:251 (+) Transcript_97403:76-828(+)